MILPSSSARIIPLESNERVKFINAVIASAFLKMILDDIFAVTKHCSFHVLLAAAALPVVVAAAMVVAVVMIVVVAVVVVVVAFVAVAIIVESVTAETAKPISYQNLQPLNK